MTLSSAESELLGAVRGGVEALGMTSLFKDFGQAANVALHMDASAALGVIQRKGVGKVRHLDVSTLWLQEQQLRQVIEFRKIHGLKNAADLLTNHVPRDVMVKHVEALGLEWRTGRSKVAAQLHWVNKKGDNEDRNLHVETRPSTAREANQESTTGRNESVGSCAGKWKAVSGPNVLMPMIALDGSSASKGSEKSPGPEARMADAKDSNSSEGDEEGKVALSCSPVHARVAEAGHERIAGKTELEMDGTNNAGDRGIRPMLTRSLRAASHVERRYQSPGNQANPESRLSCGVAVSESRNARCMHNIIGPPVGHGGIVAERRQQLKRRHRYAMLSGRCLRDVGFARTWHAGADRKVSGGHGEALKNQRGGHGTALKNQRSRRKTVVNPSIPRRTLGHGAPGPLLAFAPCLHGAAPGGDYMEKLASASPRISRARPSTSGVPARAGSLGRYLTSSVTRVRTFYSASFIVH